tara:strand:- start:37182 stop:37661 length:480 start_codon:yes stop_codon:yes gene_type:complete
MTDKAKEKSTTAKAEAKPAAKKPAAKKPAAKKPAAKKPADKSAADNQAKASTEPGQKANAARTEASEAPKAADKASEEFAGENRIKIERMNDGNQADVDVMINGRKESFRRGTAVTVSNAQLSALENSHVQYEVLDSSGDEAADVEGSASAADAEDAAE